MQKSASKSGLGVFAALVVASASASSWAEAQSAPLLISSKTGTVDCSGRDVNATAKEATLTFTGNCKEISFLGAGTTATVESATLIRINEADVEVSVGGTVNQAYLIGNNAHLTADKLGELSLTGEIAMVEAQSIGSISAAGSGNRVTWRTGTPQINDIGGDNNFAAIP